MNVKDTHVFNYAAYNSQGVSCLANNKNLSWNRLGNIHWGQQFWRVSSSFQIRVCFQEKLRSCEYFKCAVPLCVCVCACVHHTASFLRYSSNRFAVGHNRCLVNGELSYLSLVAPNICRSLVWTLLQGLVLSARF